LKTLLNIWQSVKLYFLFVTILFIGAFLYGYYSESVHLLLQSQLEGLSEVAASINDAQGKLFGLIFFNNTIKSIFFMYGGLLFGLLPFIFIVVNGAMIGYVVHLLGSMEGTGVMELVVKGLLPHGIIEIPILLLASAYGVMLGVSVIRKLLSPNRAITLEPVMLLRQSGVVVVFMTISLLLAAFIEAYISTFLLQI